MVRNVRIIKSARDARGHAISLTAKGKAVLAKAAPLWNEAQAGFEHADGVSGLADLRSVLARLNSSDREPARNIAIRLPDPRLT